MKPVIRIRCETKDVLPIDSLEPFQGELKSLTKADYVALRDQIVNTGFAFPVFVWKNEGKNYLLGGHQRVRVLKELRKSEDYHIPPIPVVYVEADDEMQAKRRILQDASSYGQIDKQGLYEFMIENRIDPGKFASNFRLPEIDVPKFNSEFFLDDVGGKPEFPGEHQPGPLDIPGAMSKKDIPETSDSGPTEPPKEKEFDHECPRCGFHF